MRRRRVVKASNLPEKLRVFDWPAWGADPHEAFHAWSQARRQYERDNPEAWPGRFERLAGSANVRAKLWGEKPPYSGSDEGQ